tara:strand:- start:130259 stop:134368 length:4110 start_codon:yes stop_codon:yes gene_type:complete
MITFRPTLKKLSCLLVIAAAHLSAHAAVDISSDPLNTYSASSSTDVKPNLMFILDNSGSMDFAYMPDDALEFGSSDETYGSQYDGRYGFVSSQCNGVYYNPATTYTPPIKADGTTRYANASFDGALRNGYDTSSGTVDLRSYFEAINGPKYDNYRNHSGFSAQPAFYYNYRGSQTAESQKSYTNTDSDFYKECNSVIGSALGSGVFTKVTASDMSGAQKQNFANWYSYYRTRLLMMKTASGLAFKEINNRFRVGFMTINNVSGETNDFLNIGDFDSATKVAWYDSLYSNETGGGTPLRRALADAGRMYAGKLTSRNGVTITDPVQYSCQQNYTILSTDGFWNGSTPYKLDGSTALDNQDAGLSRPYYDGASAQVKRRTSDLQRRTGDLQKRTRRSSGGWRSWGDVSTCDPDNSTECRYDWGAWSNVSSCTVAQSSGNGNWTIANGTDCGYANWTGWGNVSSCTPLARSSGPNYTVAQARECDTVSTGGSENSLADVAAYYYNTDLRDSTASGVDATGTCTGATVNGATHDVCANNVPSNGRDVASTQHMTTFGVGLGVRGKMAYSPTYLTDTSGDFYSVSRGLTASGSVCPWQSSGACNWPIPSSGSSANVDDLWHAAVNGHGTYFSATDPDTLAQGLKNALATIINTPRPGTAAAAASSNPNVSATDNYVFSSSYKSVEWYGELIRQRIGSDGVLSAQNWSAMRLLDCATTTWRANRDYLPNDGYRQGGVCYAVTSAYTSGATFNAAGVDTSNTAVVNIDETAATLVPAIPKTSRTIYTSNGGNLINFQWDADLPQAGVGLSTTQQNYFKTSAITYASATAGLTQFCPQGTTAADAEACLSTANQTAAAGRQLVNFLRGDRSNEGTYFRSRVHVLGDIVSSEARYVQGSLFDYSDTNYSAFKTWTTSRAGRVYVGSNDGMLHAFDAETGQEAWAYVPSIVLPKLYKLADRSYSSKHQYFVDNSPETGDICPTAPATACDADEWKTILVGGLNHGGKGYYALDITDPTVPPVLLWEFTDANLGDSYGNPRITKLKNGTWVVLLSSGYNNGDGESRMFVRNAYTGAEITTIATGVQSGFARMSAHVLQPGINNTAVAAYGGDTAGNLWRFDINGDIGVTGKDAQLLVTLTDGTKPQPITVKPLQATINGKPVIFAGTGRFLGESDIEDKQKQTFYAVKDNLDTSTYGDPHLTASNFVEQTLTKAKCPTGTSETICIPGQDVMLNSSNPVDWNTKSGWYMDFVTAGERSSTDPSLALGTLVFTTITPQASTARACGASNDSAASYLYALNYLTGGAVAGANGVTGISLGSSLVTRPVMIEQADGTVRVLIRTSSGSSSGTDLGETLVLAPPVKPPSAGDTRRVSWRLLNAR